MGICTKTFIFSLEISRLQLFYFSPYVSPKTYRFSIFCKLIL